MYLESQIRLQELEQQIKKIVPAENKTDVIKQKIKSIKKESKKIKTITKKINQTENKLNCDEDEFIIDDSINLLDIAEQPAQTNSLHKGIENMASYLVDFDDSNFDD